LITAEGPPPSISGVISSAGMDLLKREPYTSPHCSERNSASFSRVSKPSEFT
jgi:hypothetical protein